MSFFDKLFDRKANEPAQETGPEKIWNEVYQARYALYERHFGRLPQDILKIMDLSGAWPGGGLYAIPADKLGSGKMVYATFGFSNPDMPTEVMPVDVSVNHDAQQRPAQTSLTLKKKDNIRPKTERPGYGYELIVVSEEQADWPLYILQWAARAEIVKDADILGRVQQYDGLTVERVQIGQNMFANLLFTKARSPLIDKLSLPNGSAEIIVATIVTDAEMRWSIKHGRSALLNKLIDAGVGQVSRPGRNSVVADDAAGAARPGGPALDEAELMDVTSREAAAELAAKGRLYQCLLFPAELGGQDVLPNVIYIPHQAAEKRAAAIARLRQAANTGEITSLTVNQEYKGSSHVPSKLLFTSKHDATGKDLSLVVEVW
jgi:hypothetical protein